MKGYKTVLTAEQEQYLRDNFADTTNDELAAHLGCCPRVLSKFARKFGLKKSEEHLRLQREKGYRMNQALRLAGIGYPPKGFRIPNNNGGFKKGENIKSRVGEERWKEICHAMSEKRRQVLASERRRVLFGLEQRTKLKVTKQSSSKLNYAYYLRKRGYIQDSDNYNLFYYPSEEMRRPRLERNAPKHGIRIVALGDKK